MISPNHLFSRGTFAARFLVRRTRGEGGQVAFSRSSPKRSLKQKLKRYVVKKRTTQPASQELVEKLPLHS